MKKRAKVHLLPTDKTDGTLWKTTSGQLIHTHVSGEYKEKYQPFNLYITTDDEIKGSDWYYNSFVNEVWRCGDDFISISQANELTNGERRCFKIIATTDPELNLSEPHMSDKNAWWCGKNAVKKFITFSDAYKYWQQNKLPQIPQSFIKEYCRVGGIGEVDVEYGLFHDGNFKDDDETHAFKAIRKPRVNSHNEITIHSII